MVEWSDKFSALTDHSNTYHSTTFLCLNYVSRFRARRALLISFIAPILLIAVWCVLTYGNLVSPDTLPTPTEVIRGTLQLFIEYDLASSIWISAKRIGLAFLLASAVALPLGVLMGAFEPINRFFEPIVAPLRYMPISAFIPLLIWYFGIYESQKIAFLFLGVFVYLLPVVVFAIRAVPEELVQTALTLGASKFQVIYERSAAGGVARYFRFVPRDERDFVDLCDFRGSRQSRTRTRLYGRAGADAPESFVVVCRIDRHRRHRPDDRFSDSRDFKSAVSLARKNVLIYGNV